MKNTWILQTIALAAIASGCGSGRSRGADAGWQTCVDQDGVVVDERQCQQPGVARSGGGFYPYRWYYYPYGGNPYPVGYRIPTGGTYLDVPYAGIATRSIGVPSSGARATSVAGTTRGGFGATGAGHASGGE